MFDESALNKTVHGRELIITQPIGLCCRDSFETPPFVRIVCENLKSLIRSWRSIAAHVYEDLGGRTNCGLSLLGGRMDCGQIIISHHQRYYRKGYPEKVGRFLSKKCVFLRIKRIRTCKFS